MQRDHPGNQSFSHWSCWASWPPGRSRQERRYDDQASLRQLVSYGSVTLHGRSSIMSVGLWALRMSWGSPRLLLEECDLDLQHQGKQLNRRVIP